MNSNEHNIWSKIGSQVREYQPDAFEEDNWLEMEELLKETPPAPLWSLSKWLKWLGGATLVGLVGIYFWIGGINNDSPSLVTQSEVASTTQQEPVSSSEMDQSSSSELSSSAKEQPSTLLEKENGASKKEDKANISITEVPNREKIASTIDKRPSSKLEISEIVSEQLPSSGGKNEILEKNGGMASPESLNQLKGEGSRIPSSDEAIVTSLTPADDPTADASTFNTETPQEQLLEENQDADNSNDENGTTLETKTTALRKQLLSSSERILLTSLNFRDESNPLNSILLPKVADLDITRGPNRFLFGKRRFGVSVGLSTVISDYATGQISMSPHFGLFVSQTLSRRWEVQLETQLKIVRNYDLSQIYEEEIVSSLGEVGSSRITLTYRGYTTLEFPVTFKYALNNRFGILVGGRYSFLVEGHAAESNQSSGVTSSLASRIPRRGFWSHDFALTAGLEFYLTRRWRLDFRYNQGFRDITPDNLYQDTQNHFNTDLQISIHRMF